MIITQGGPPPFTKTREEKLDFLPILILNITKSQYISIKSSLNILPYSSTSDANQLHCNPFFPSGTILYNIPEETGKVNCVQKSLYKQRVRLKK